MRILVSFEHEQDGTDEIAIYPPDVIRWEQKFGAKFSDLYSTKVVPGETGANGEPKVEVKMNVGQTDLAFMAWACLKRKGTTSAAFEQWRDGLLDVELAGVDDPKATRTDQ